MASKIMNLDSAKSKWKDFINPNCFLELEENIEKENDNLKKLYDNFEKNPTNRMIFLADEKKILKSLEDLENKKINLNINYDEAIGFLYGKINRTNTDYPYNAEVDGKVYYFRLSFDDQEHINPNRKYYIEVSSESSNSEYERIPLNRDDFNNKSTRKARDIIR